MRYFFLVLTLLFVINNASATVIVNITPPPPKEVIIIPKTHKRCVVIPSGIYNGVYVNAHQVCQSNGQTKEVWVAGHWQCTNYRPLRGICLSWMWIPSHMTTTPNIVVIQ